MENAAVIAHLATMLSAILRGTRDTWTPMHIHHSTYSQHLKPEYETALYTVAENHTCKNVLEK